MPAKGLFGQRGWSDKGKVALVRLMLKYHRDVLLAQLGMLSQVRVLVACLAVHTCTFMGDWTVMHTCTYLLAETSHAL